MTRGPYRQDRTFDLARIEQRRARAGITLEDLADRAGIGIASLRRIRRTGLAFPRTIVALRMALRAIEKDRKLAEQLFPQGEA